MVKKNSSFPLLVCIVMGYQKSSVLHDMCQIKTNCWIYPGRWHTILEWEGGGEGVYGGIHNRGRCIDEV